MDVVIPIVVGTVGAIIIVVVASLVHGLFSIIRVTRIQKMVDEQSEETRRLVGEGIRQEMGPIVTDLIRAVQEQAIRENYKMIQEEIWSVQSGDYKEVIEVNRLRRLLKEVATTSAMLEGELAKIDSPLRKGIVEVQET